jgi:thiol-disulfide isomerase/thioredoxin
VNERKHAGAKRGGGFRVASAVGLALVALLFWMSQTTIAVRPANRAPQASSLELRDLDGRELSLAGLRGKVVLINLWASWCGPCRSEIELGPRGLVVLGINVEELAPGRVADLGAELGIDYPIAQLAGPLAGTFADEGVLPQSWLIDRRGRVRATQVGWAPERAFRRACERLLQEP